MSIEIHSEENNLSFDTLNVSYIEQGRGTPTILLPGWPMGNQMFGLMTPYFDKEKFKLIAPNYPGWDGSTVLNEKITYDSLSSWLCRFMDNKGISKANLFGVSFGGSLAVNFANKYPDRVNRMVLNAPAVFEQPLEWYQNVLVRATEAFPASKVYIHEKMNKGNPLAWLLILKTIPNLNNPFKNRVFDQIKTSKLKALDETLSQIRETNLRAILPKICVPTLLVTGNEDYMLKDSMYASNQISGSKLVILKGKHDLPESRPQKLSELASEFFNS